MKTEYIGRGILYTCCSSFHRCFGRVAPVGICGGPFTSIFRKLHVVDGTLEMSQIGKMTVTNSVCQLHKSRFIAKLQSSSRLSVSLPYTHNRIAHITPHSLLNPYLTADLDVSRAGSAERLDGKHLVVEVAGGESVVLPGSEVVGDSDSAAGALALADREVLAESAGALDGRLVDLRVLADLVGRAVAGDAADGLGAADRARVVAVVLHDVVLCNKVSLP